jgi:hypothetical protein
MKITPLRDGLISYAINQGGPPFIFPRANNTFPTRSKAKKLFLAPTFQFLLSLIIPIHLCFIYL